MNEFDEVRNFVKVAQSGSLYSHHMNIVLARTQALASILRKVVDDDHTMLTGDNALAMRDVGCRFVMLSEEEADALRAELDISGDDT